MKRYIKEFSNDMKKAYAGTIAEADFEKLSDRVCGLYERGYITALEAVKTIANYEYVSMEG